MAPVLIFLFRIKRTSRHICSAPISPELRLSADVSRRASMSPAERRCLHIKRQYRRIKWRVFRDVSQCFKSGSRCFMIYHILQVFHDVLQCLVSRATIGIAASATTRPIKRRRRPRADRLTDRDNVAEIGDNSAEIKIGDNSAEIKIVNIASKVIPC